ncbi:MAG: tripartite tricarboxylate transporter TctB family protein [Hyphomicrobiaceae bacterium]
MIKTRRLSFLGLGVITFGILLLIVAIPYAVTSPSNVQAVVLAPTFWPTIIGGLIIALGTLMVALKALADPEESEPLPQSTDTLSAWGRLVATGVVMIALVYIIPIIGMVWATMLAFVALSVIIRASQPLLSIVVAVLLPLMLYAFFSHVAGVSVPQGEFITLP